MRRPWLQPPCPSGFDGSTAFVNNFWGCKETEDGVQVCVEGGLLKVRPMHMQHTFEAALLCTEAFQQSMDPPEFGKML